MLLTLASLTGCAADAETTAPNPESAIATGSLVTAKAVPVGCAGGTFDVKVTPEIADRYGDAVTTAFTDWEKTLGGTVAFRIATDATAKDAWNQCEIDVVWQTDSRTGIFGEARTEAEPTTKRTAASVVYLVDTATLNVDGVVYATMLHEIGHALGLVHDTVHGDRTAMWPYLTVPAKLGCADVRQACDVWGCTPACEGNSWAE